MPIGLGPWELIIILLIVVVIFGAGRLSEVGGAVGKSIREFRKATGDEQAAAAAKDQQAVAAPAAPVAAVPVAPVAAVPLAAAPAATTAPVATAAPVAVAENTCPSCATVNPPSQVFCGQCGTRLTKAA
jgi:sec-independent protein translocase protein TatA